MMQIVLNSKQAEGLAGFFFDIAKGLMLGGIGFAAIVPLEIKLATVLLSTIFAFIFIRFALILLE